MPIEEAVPGSVNVKVVCPEGGEAWLLELVADDEAEYGVRAMWTDPSAEGGRS